MIMDFHKIYGAREDKKLEEKYLDEIKKLDILTVDSFVDYLMPRQNLSITKDTLLY